MSLTSREMSRTAEEMARNLDVSGLGVEDLAGWSGMSVPRVRAVLTMDGTSSPADTWLIRDCLDLAVREWDVSGGGWTVLTDRARDMALQWFVLSEVPPRPASLI